MGLTAIQRGQGPQGGQGLGVQVGGGGFLGGGGTRPPSGGSRGLLEPRYFTLTVWMGSMADWAIRWTPCPHAGQGLQGVEQGGGGAAHQLRGLAGDHLAVRELDGHGGLAGALGGQLAAATTGRMSGVTPACCISSSSLYTVWSEPLPWRRSHRAS